jgi:predicted phage baseplate assembly protein
MPLEQSLPQIDDRRYDEIMAEIRARIARYTPEWTPVWSDVNDNDPGVTMVQVFAWLAEMLTYRMSKVPELNYLKFLQLLGLELNPAEPALAEITFPVEPTHPKASVIVPARTQVSAESPDGGPPIVFETDRGLNALTAQLKSVQAFDSYAYSLVTAENEDATQGFEPLGSLANTDSALLLGFEYDPRPPLTDFPSSEFNLYVWVMVDQRASPAVQCGLPIYAPARIRWEFWNGSDWQSLDLLKDETLALTRSGHVHLKKPAKGFMPQDQIGAERNKLFWIRAHVELSQYERPPKLLAIRTNTISARQVETITDEVLGGSNGSRNQVFQLANAPVVRDTLRLEVDQGAGFEPWTCVDDFFGSGPNELHYILNRTSGEVRFGDGLHGSIPIANVDNADGNVVARQYGFGGGRRGNVAAKMLKSLVTPVDGIDEGAVMNVQAANSGRDEETLEQAKNRARHLVSSRDRAVSAGDFEYLAGQAANIRRAKALPLSHPSFPGVKVPGVVTVIVVPDSAEQAPVPSDGTLRAVCAYLDERRMLTTEVYVVKPIYQQVVVQAEVIVDDKSDLGEVKQSIETVLLDYFHPLKGGEDRQGWPFGGTIFYSRVYQHVFTVPGVQSITTLDVVLDGESYHGVDVPLQDGALVYSMQHDIQVQYRFDA